MTDTPVSPTGAQKAALSHLAADALGLGLGSGRDDAAPEAGDAAGEAMVAEDGAGDAAGGARVAGDEKGVALQSVLDAFVDGDYDSVSWMELGHPHVCGGPAHLTGTGKQIIFVDGSRCKAGQWAIGQAPTSPTRCNKQPPIAWLAVIGVVVMIATGGVAYFAGAHSKRNWTARGRA